MDDEIDPEIAAAMGFTGFGAINKRKFGSTTDTFVDGQARKTQKSGTGANDTALGSRKKMEAGSNLQAENQESGQNKTNGGEHMTNAKGKNKMKANAPMGLADYITWGNNVAEPDTQTNVTQPDVTHSGSPFSAQSTSTPPGGALSGSAGTSSWPQGMPNQQELAALRRGVQNERGDMVFFLPSFIEDPWKGLG